MLHATCCMLRAVMQGSEVAWVLGDHERCLRAAIPGNSELRLGGQTSHFGRRQQTQCLLRSRLLSASSPTQRRFERVNVARSSLRQHLLSTAWDARPGTGRNNPLGGLSSIRRGAESGAEALSFSAGKAAHHLNGGGLPSASSPTRGFCLLVRRVREKAEATWRDRAGTASWC